MIELPSIPQNLRPNVDWINLTKLRPDWVSSGRIFHITPAAVIEIHDSVMSAAPGTERFIPMFFKKATEVFSKLTPPETPGTMVFAKTTIEVNGHQCILHLGIHFDEAGECYISASYNWREET